MDLTGFKLTCDDEFNSFAWCPDGTVEFNINHTAPPAIMG